MKVCSYKEPSLLDTYWPLYDTTTISNYLVVSLVRYVLSKNFHYKTLTGLPVKLFVN